MILDHQLSLTNEDVKKLTKAIPADKKIHQMMAEIRGDKK